MLAPRSLNFLLLKYQVNGLLSAMINSNTLPEMAFGYARIPLTLLECGMRLAWRPYMAWIENPPAQPHAGASTVAFGFGK